MKRLPEKKRRIEVCSTHNVKQTLIGAPNHSAKVRRIEEIMGALFKSEAKARIYIFLVVRGGALAGEIEKGTCLHPSTVREALSEMVRDSYLSRAKTKKGAGAGRTPYSYCAVPIRSILKGYAEALESHLKTAGRRT